MEIKRTIGVAELARRIGICRNTAYTLVSKKEFYPAYRIGKKICIDEDLLEKWIDEQGRRKANACSNC